MKVYVEKEAEDFLEKKGFPIVRRYYCSTPQEAVKKARALTYPVAMKVVSEKIIHKTDVGGVALNLKSDAEVRKEFNTMKKLKGATGVLIQEYNEGLFLLCGLKKDATFGHAVVLGAGGIYTEIMKDVAFRVCPITTSDVQSMIDELKIKPALYGARGKKVNIHNIIKVMLKLSELAQHYPEIKELDINPLIVNEDVAVVVDARIVFE